jgi:Ca2+-binding RTX toxin-like protein
MPVVAAVGTTLNLPSILTSEFGTSPYLWSQAWVTYVPPSGGASYWNPGSPFNTTWSVDGTDIGAGFANQHNVPASDFSNVVLTAGNNITPQGEFLTVPADNTFNNFIQYAFSIVDPHLMSATAGQGEPTPQDIVASANRFDTFYGDGAVANTVDCHFIAQDVAAAAGAVMGDNTESLDPTQNEETGFWRIVYRGSDPNPVGNWQSLVQPGDIVRIGWEAGGFHTTTVLQTNLDANHTMLVYDNANGVISEHTANYDQDPNTHAQVSIPTTITIYRLTTDGLYLENGAPATTDETLPGTLFNDHVIGGSGNDTLYGNVGNDVIDGGNGNDTLNGGVGIDTMTGGAGNDLYFVDNGSDTVTEAAGGGTDRVLTSVNYTLAAGQSIESFTPTSFATTTSINLTGNTLAQSILGNAGNNIIDDGGAGASDLLEGFGGNDSYRVNNVHDIVIEAAGAGTDQLLTSVSFVLGAGQSIETLATTGAAGTTALHLTGNALAQTIVGNAGNNVINDGGAGGADTLEGLGGNDLLFVNNTGDAVIEAAGGGTDRVLTTVSFTLGANQSVESLTPANSATTTSINLTGNTLGQTIIGNAGTNTLNDGGAGSPDTLSGLGGNDTYIVNNSHDVVIEAAGGGSDHVLTSVSFVLGIGQSVEALNPTSFAGTTALHLTGNALAQTIIGNAGNNSISDGGAGAADTLQGLGGNDLYTVNNSADVIMESTNGGTDRVLTSVSYTLGAGQSIESLTPVNYSTTTAINLTGNTLNQTVIGNAGNNVINGGAGNDNLQGMGGSDTFVFNTALSASTNFDHVLDFVHGTDKIELDHAIFTTLAVGNPLAATAFTTGAPTTANQHILYNTSTGVLSYDDDGNGAHAAVGFAVLTTHPALTNTDFFVV